MNQPGPRGWSPDALVAHVREVVAELSRRHDRRLSLRAPLDLPDGWTSADANRPWRVAWRPPYGQRCEAVGCAAEAPLRALRWRQDAPHPEDLAQLRNWLAGQPLLVDAVLVCGAPVRTEAEVLVPLRLWVPRLWLVARPEGGAEVHLVLRGEDDLDAVLEEVRESLAQLRPVPQQAVHGVTDAAGHDADTGVPAPEPAGQEPIGALVEALREGRAAKAVWSREIVLTQTLPRSQFAARMAANRPEAWLVDVQLPDLANLLAATPELLVRCAGDTVATMALAGTGTPTELLADSSRLDEEHGHVRTFVTERLQQLGAQDWTQSVDIAAAGPLRHRRTQLTARRPRDEHGVPGFDALGAVLHLHPTPALLGYPREAALALLAPLEAPRGLYGGCVARLACDGSGDGEAVVLLRGVSQVDGAWRARAGAGLVPASRAQDEAQEIANKLAAILDSLRPEAT